jgi:hypothetical protein
MAALAVGDCVLAERFLEAHIAFCRSHGVLGGLATSLVSQAWSKIHLGELGITARSDLSDALQNRSTQSSS